MKQIPTLLFALLLFYGCGNSTGTSFSTSENEVSSPATYPRTIYIPRPGTSFSIVLDGQLPKYFSGSVVDLDAFETTKEQIDALHAEGKRIFAYVSVGSWELDRPDSDAFANELIGKVCPGWEDEKFLNIKALEQLAPHIRSRFDMIARKGFDGIEADNIDIYTVDTDGNNGTGFGITLADTKRYADFLIAEAHRRGLSIGQKNAPELVEAYGDLFDWALIEDPFYEKYADSFKIYTVHEKAVFSLSYLDNTSSEYFRNAICPGAEKFRFSAILKERDLDSTETTCPK